MQTQLDLPPDLLRAAVDEAQRRGATLDQMVSDALVRELARCSAVSGHRSRFPVFPSNRPGSLSITAADLLLVEEEDDRARGGLAL